MSHSEFRAGERARSQAPISGTPWQTASPQGGRTQEGRFALVNQPFPSGIRLHLGKKTDAISNLKDTSPYVKNKIIPGKFPWHFLMDKEKKNKTKRRG
jgi:hypothetical protein